MSKKSKASSDEHGRSDSVLVRIAERPLVVGGIFFLTAVFPWLIYFAAPGIARAVQTTSVTDLVQWLSLPLLFLAVNGVVFFLWMNHCKNSGGSGGGSVLDGGGGGVFSTGDGDGHGDDWNSVFHAHREAKNVEEIVMDAKRFIAGSGRKEIDRSSSWGTEMEEAVPKKTEAQLRSRRRHEDEKEEVVDRIIPKKMESSRSRRREERVEDEDEGDRRKMEVSRSWRRRQEERVEGEEDRVASRKMESSRSRRRQEEDLARSRRRQEEEEEQARELDAIRREMELPVKEVRDREMEIPQRKEERDRGMEFPLRKEEPEEEEEEDEDEDEEPEEEREEDREVERIRRELQLPRRDEEKKSYQVPSPPAPAKKKSSNAAAAAAVAAVAKSEQLDSIDELRVARSKHKKAHSLKLDEKFLEELHKDQQAQPSPPHRVTRRNSSPAKSRTPTTSLLGLEIDPKHVTRRNSSPKTMTMTPTAASMSTSFSGGGGGGYVPPVRPIPLDKDDLNNRIDSFLTKFRMERQESNLRAVLHEE